MLVEKYIIELNKLDSKILHSEGLIQDLTPNFFKKLGYLGSIFSFSRYLMVSYRGICCIEALFCLKSQLF